MSNWSSNIILLPLSWMGADVYLDTNDNTLCYEADSERLVVLTRCNLANVPLRYRNREATNATNDERTQSDSSPRTPGNAS